MGKSKKVKKGSKDDNDSDVEVEVPKGKSSKEAVSKIKGKSKSKYDDSSSDDEDRPAPVKAFKKKTESEEKVIEVTQNLKKLEVGNKKKTKKKPISDDDSESDGDDSMEEKSVQNKSKPAAKKGGFSLLMGDQTSSESEQHSEESDASEVEKPKVVRKKPPPKENPKDQVGKKGKKSKKKKDDSDDDIDKVLAELEMEYSGKKPMTAPEKVTASINLGPVEDEGKATKDDADEQEDQTAVRTAAQKKKEKKDREKLKKQAAKKQEADVKESTPIPDEPSEVATEAPADAQADAEPAEEDGGETIGDKKKKKKKGEKVVDDKAKKGPAKKAIAAMQETLKKIKEEEERLQREEEERIKQEEEREEQRLEMIRLEKEKKDRKKKKEKERKEKLKAEGKFLTPKQKADKARALAMIESLKEQGTEEEGKPEEQIEKKPRLGTRVRPGRLKKQTSDEHQAAADGSKVNVEIIDAKSESKAEAAKKELIKDSWDAESSSSENDADNVPTGVPAEKNKAAEAEKIEERTVSSDDGSSDSEEESDSGDDEAEVKVDASDAKLREKALIRIKKRQEEDETNREASSLRAAIVCVLGHVDTGKTKILDKLRRTNVQDGEAGGITQQIGATNVPIENIKDQTRHVKGVNLIEFKIPGLLIIDTPGHESFSNLRSRGSSLCDIAILVVDIMHGLEPQTLESINLLKARKTPFIVALNKMDRLYDWQSAQRKDIKDIIKAQHTNTQNEFDTRTKEVILQFAEQGLNAALYYENPDVRTYVSLVPTSAVTGEGMGNLLALIIQSCEGMLHKRLLFSHQLQATVLEVKAIPGLGTTIDAILINGTLREGDTMVLAGTDGPIVTQIRSLLMPQPMKELRVKNAYIEYKEVVAAQGVKIAAKDLEKAVAGLNLLVAHKPDEVDILRELVAKDLKKALSGIKLSDRGVYVQASTLGSLEALLEFLKSSKIPYSAIRIGPVVKRDVMKASAMLEHESQYAVILAFDVKVERDAQEMADNLGVTIFQADIIYHLFDKFMAHRDQLKQRKREEFKHIAVFPCKLKILPQFIFNSRDPIVVGVIVEAGIVKEGTPICVPSKEFVDIGIVTSIESNHKQVETARKGMEVCIKIDPIPGEAPKMFGRHFDDTDFLVSKISRASIDACKDYFRDDLVKTDWQLMVELKNLFQIL